MIFSKDNLSNETLDIIIKNEELNLNNTMEFFNLKRASILVYLQRIADCIQKIEDTDNCDVLFSILADLREMSKKMDSISSGFKSVFNELHTLSFSSENLSTEIDGYNSHLENFNSDLSSFFVESEKITQKVLVNFDFVLLGSTMISEKPVQEIKEEVPNTIEPNIVVEENKTENNNENLATPANSTTDIKPEVASTTLETNSQPLETTTVSVPENTTPDTQVAPIVPEPQPQPESEVKVVIPDAELTDNNCLTISEKKKKVFLPYKINELRSYLESFPDEYSSVNEFIENEFIIPLDRFKNPSLSRFKETYTLMRNKEHATFLASFTYALEQTFNYALNPAVILACRNKYELDTYLDCLYAQELEKFKFFDIIFEVNPL